MELATDLPFKKSPLKPSIVRLDPPADGPTNMAIDASLLDELNVRPIAARVYSWSAPWVTLGKFQDPARDLKANCPIPYAMRPTGGRAVLHGHDVTFGLAMRLELFLQEGETIEALSRSVRRAYRGAVGPVVQALRKCGIDACLGEEIKGLDQGPKSADCFAHLSANDVLDRKTLKKACGVAMLLTSDSVLVQASAPVGKPLVDPRLVYDAPSTVSEVDLDAKTFADALENALQDFGLEKR